MEDTPFSQEINTGFDRLRLTPKRRFVLIVKALIYVNAKI